MSRANRIGVALICAAIAASGPLPLATQARAAALSEAKGLQPGMVVLDRHGRKVGVILRLGERRDERRAVLVDDSGAQFTVLRSQLRLTRSGDEAVTSLSRSQRLTRAILNGD